MAGPLQGVTVVAIEQAVAGPFATRQLADLGARVIKIERPDGGDFARGYDTTVKGLASWFVWLNRTKESVTLDLKRPEAADVLDRLLRGADVFLQNLAPGAVDRLGLSAAALRSRYPRLIVCNISGYGTTGPYADRKAYDLLIQSEVGLLSITGTEDTPSKVGISIADISAGMYAYSGVLAALLTRARTGDGTVLDVALIDTLGEWMTYAALYTEHGGTQPPRTGATHATIAPYGPFRTHDGALVVAVQSNREWGQFCAHVLQQPALADDARFATNALRVHHREALTSAIEAVFLALPLAEVLRRLEGANLASANVNSVREYVQHPQLTHRDCWREVGTPGGPIRALIPPVRMEGVEPVMGAVPALGQHTRAVLEELAFDGDTIAHWAQSGVI
ncbi:MAG TPA: CaiB/BaiF CoA-transferase family protein [Vicinamibacterales bacterium]|jgi:crotonobetainyl-CoA:carnitine CoA-transferase CaiB-like acyl-CoA transferase|nr:CaiB/BaiF CoA-transferase family protein [Vicinamibacterales bacterium]